MFLSKRTIDIYFSLFFEWQDLAKVSSHLKYALKFSLSNSSRPPQMFSPHQKILWILDVWSSVDAGKWNFLLNSSTCSVISMLMSFLVLQSMKKFPASYLRCGSGGINRCGCIALFLSRYLFLSCCGLSAISNFVFIDELPFSCYSNCIQSFSSTAVYDIPVPDVLIQPVVTATVFQIL